jgi:hypothetical protein
MLKCILGCHFDLKILRKAEIFALLSFSSCAEDVFYGYSSLMFGFRGSDPTPEAVECKSLPQIFLIYFNREKDFKNSLLSPHTIRNEFNFIKQKEKNRPSL